MTPKMREIIGEAGYSFCTTCWGEGTNSHAVSRENQGRLPHEMPIGGSLPKPCPVCKGDGVIKKQFPDSVLSLKVLTNTKEQTEEGG